MSQLVRLSLPTRPMQNAAEPIDGDYADTSLSVLQAIRLRYLQKEIYTYSGIVLIATNPFARVDSLYVPGMVQVYAGKQRATQAPHLFAIAEEAFMYDPSPLPLPLICQC